VRFSIPDPGPIPWNYGEPKPGGELMTLMDGPAWRVPANNSPPDTVGTLLGDGLEVLRQSLLEEWLRHLGEQEVGAFLFTQRVR